MKTLFERHTTIIVTVFWMLIGLTVVGAQSYAAPSQTVPLATEPLATETVEPCPEWRKAGVQVIHKCVDEDHDMVCFVPVGGVMQCQPMQ